MAVITATPNSKINAEILVNGVALQEYEDDEENTRAAGVTKYVEARSGAAFAIRWRIDGKPRYDLVVYIFMDGDQVTGKFLKLKDFRNSRLEHTTDSVTWREDAQWLRSEFSFSDLRTVDSVSEMSKQNLTEDLKRMGQITLKFYDIKDIKRTTGVHSRPRKVELGDIAEKALKGRALSHQSILLPPTVGEERRVENFVYVDPDRKPFACINFKYRSKEALQSLLIVPRSDNEVTLEERDLDTLSPQEMRQLLQRQRERSQAIRDVKQEIGVKRERSVNAAHTGGGEADDDDDVTFVSAKRTKLPTTLNEDGIETIDLT